MEKLISNEVKTLDSFERDLNKSFKEIKYLVYKRKTVTVNQE